MTLHLKALGHENSSAPGDPIYFVLTPPSVIRTKVGDPPEPIAWSFDGGAAPYSYQIYYNNVLRQSGSVDIGTHKSFRTHLYISPTTESNYELHTIIEDANGTTVSNYIFISVSTTLGARPVASNIVTNIPRGGAPVDINWSASVSASSGFRFDSLVVGTQADRFAGIQETLFSDNEFFYDLKLPYGYMQVTAIPGGSLAEATDFYWIYDETGIRSNTANLAFVTYDAPLAVDYLRPGPERVQTGVPFGLYAESNRIASWEMQKSINASTWSNVLTESTPTDVFSKSTSAVIGDNNYYWRARATSGSETAISSNKRILVEQNRASGLLASEGSASSMHVFYDATLADPITNMEVRITIPYDLSDNILTFWGFQCSFRNSSNVELAGGHMGLQFINGYPNKHAINWGGYLTSNGSELSGSTSPLPSALSNPNTRNFNWIPGREYIYKIYKVSDGVWGASIFDTVTSVNTFIRELYVSGATRLGTNAVVFTELFSSCEAQSREAVWRLPKMQTSTVTESPTSGYVNYQSYADGGCTNTNTSLTTAGDGWLMKTNTTRLPFNHQGVRLNLNS